MEYLLWAYTALVIHKKCGLYSGLYINFAAVYDAGRAHAHHIIRTYYKLLARVNSLEKRKSVTLM